ncbi:MAG: addiction module HigA family antidote [Gammaproteobacteria bacterium]
MTQSIHPGEHLAEFLQEYEISQSSLAKRMGVPRMRVSQIVRGERSITADSAIRLGVVFGTTPQFWMNLQARSDLEAAQAQVDPRSIEPLVA